MGRREVKEQRGNGGKKGGNVDHSICSISPVVVLVSPAGPEFDNENGSDLKMSSPIDPPPPPSPPPPIDC